jgi:hypothetical protein
MLKLPRRIDARPGVRGPGRRLDARIFLRVGDEVNHRRYPQWGTGVVVEERVSTLHGGLCMVRVVFADGQERSFINNLDDENCCYYAGIRLMSSS